MTRQAFYRMMDWKRGWNMWLFQSAELNALELFLHNTKQGGGGLTVKKTKKKTK
jgi:hypothetical protein